MDFGEELGNVGEVMRGGSAGDEIEGGVEVGDVLGVDGFKADVLDIAVGGDLLGLGQHAFGDVGGDDGLRVRCDCEGGEPGAGCDIEGEVVAVKSGPLGEDSEAVARRVWDADGVLARLTVELFLRVGGHERWFIMNSTVRSIEVVAASSS